jgi:hypothetical protein
MQLKSAREDSTQLMFSMGLRLIPCLIPVNPNLASPPLRILDQPGTGYLALSIALEQYFFAQQQLKITAIFTKDVGAKLAKFIANKYAGIALALENALITTEINPDLRIVLMTDVSTGADAIIAQPQIMTFLQ